MENKTDLAKFKEFYDEFPEAFFIAEIVTDEAGKGIDFTYIYSNKAYIDLCGFSQDQLVDHTYSQVFGRSLFLIDYFTAAALENKKNTVSEYVKERERYFRMTSFPIMPKIFGCVVIDVTPEDDMKRQLQMEQESIIAIMESTGFEHWVYDIQHDRAFESTKSQKTLGVPAVMENYPQSFLDMNMLPEKDWKTYLEIYDKLKKGAKEATGEYQMWPPHDEHPHWERLIYKTIFDDEGNPVRAIGTAIDISAQKYLEERFEDFLEYHQRLLPSLTDAFRLNISKNTIMPLKDPFGFFKKNGHISMSRFFEMSEKYICEPKGRRRYKKLFTRDKLLEIYKRGEKAAMVECAYRIDGRKQWLRIVVNMTRDPKSTDIIGITYTEDLTEEKTDELALKLMVGRNYELMLRVDGQSDEFVVFLYDGKLQDVPLRSGNIIDYLQMEQYHYLGLRDDELSLSGILERLKREGAFNAYYEVMVDDVKHVKKLQFCMLEEESDQFCVGRSDVTNDLYGK